MLYFNRTDVSEGMILITQAHQMNVLIVSIGIYYIKGCMKLIQPDICNGCHDALMMSMNLNDIANLKICGAVYYCIINGISKIYCKMLI